VFTDESGRTVKDLKTGMSMPEWVAHPVKDRESFRRVLDERFQPCLEQRMPPDYADRVARFNRPDFDALLLPPVGGYWWTLQTLCGVDVAATMLYDCPDQEMERLFPLMCEGGFIPKIDHSVSSDISWDNFRYYMEKLLALHERCANRA
jgi:hypothetical protein